MIDRVADSNGNDAPAPSSLRDDLDCLRRAAHERRWRRFVGDLRDATITLKRMTTTVETQWRELSEEDQDIFLLVRDVLETIVASGPPTHPSIVERVIAKLIGSDDNEKRLVWQFAVAVGGFMAALQQALRREDRARAIVDGTMITDPEAAAAVERGIEEYRAGRGNVYSLEEFQARFNLS